MDKSKILIVEDEYIIAEDIKRILKKSGYEVVGNVQTGEDAIESVEEHQPELVLMDIHLKTDMSGIEAAQIIYDNYRIPFVYLTAYADKKTLEKAKITQPLGYVLKPFDTRELLAAVEIALYEHEMKIALKKSESKYRNLVQSLNDGVIVINDNEKFTFANEAAENIFGKSKQDLLNMQILDFTDQEGSQKIKKQKEIHSSKKRIFEITISTADDELKILEFNGRPVFENGKFKEMFVILSDITHRKIIENKLKENNITLSQEVKKLKKELKQKREPDLVMGESSAIRNVIKKVKIVAPTNLNVLIQGESGTGKEIIANLIHQHSDRQKKPFVAIDCGAIPETLIESEFFGYVKGAFTGANKTKKGKFEQANTGTIFLDEIGNLSLESQKILLRVIQERTINKIGSKKKTEIDVRIIAASNINLKQAVKKKVFRSDLFHRLNEFALFLPTLKERKDDIPILTKTFIDEANLEFGKNIEGVSHGTLSLLNNYNWPGNIRELKNVIKRAVLLEDNNLIHKENIDLNIDKEEMFNKNKGIDTNIEKILKQKQDFYEVVNNYTDKIEEEIIVKVLKQTKYNKSKAAKLLGIDRNTLYNKLSKLNIKL